MHRKLIRRLLWMFVFVIAISAAVIYFTFDIRALEYLTMFEPWCIAAAFGILGLGLVFDGLRLMTLAAVTDEKLTPGFHRLRPFVPKRSTSLISCHNVVLLPRQCLNIIGLGCSAFARHYLRNHFCFLLLWVLRCFSSPRSPSLRNDWPSTSRVAPFGNLGIKGYLHLPQAYRSLSRPSSPPRAKASTVCPCLLSVSLTPVPFLLLKLKTVSD